MSLLETLSEQRASIRKQIVACADAEKECIATINQISESDVRGLTPEVSAQVKALDKKLHDAEHVRRGLYQDLAQVNRMISQYTAAKKGA